MNKLALQLILALAIGVCGAFAESAVSPDGEYVVFVKTVSGPTIGWGAGDEQAISVTVTLSLLDFLRQAVSVAAPHDDALLLLPGCSSTVGWADRKELRAAKSV
jgi:hypothetical protein